MLGFLLVLLSAFFFCFQNVIVRLLFTEHTLFGMFPVGGFVTPTLHHSFLLMAQRMVWVVPLMGLLAAKLYPPTWQEIRQLTQQENRPLLRRSLVCGGLMFLYLALLYVAIGLIPTGIALTLFFTYPAFTALLSWRWLGDRPTLLRWGVMGLVFVGSVLTMPALKTGLDHNSWLGIVTGIASGGAYALYTVLAQQVFKQLHPVPFTWLSFTTTLVLASASLVFWNLQEHLPWLSLWIGGLLSAIFTFAGHLLNNLGIRRIGATTAAMVSASNPALTVVLAWLAIQETLSGRQLAGTAIVTLSVALLSWEHRRTVSKSA